MHATTTKSFFDDEKRLPTILQHALDKPVRQIRSEPNQLSMDIPDEAAPFFRRAKREYNLGSVVNNWQWSSSHLRSALGEQVVDQIESNFSVLPADSKVLELGHARGSLLRSLADRFPHLSFYGIDVAHSLLKPEPHPRCTFLEGDVQQLPYVFRKPHPFKAIISVNTLPFVPDKLRAIGMAYLMLEEGGMAWHLVGKEYFSPSGECLIPKNPERRDIFWNENDRVVHVIKTGRGAPFRTEYDGCRDSWRVDQVGSLLSYSCISYYHGREKKRVEGSALRAASGC